MARRRSTSKTITRKKISDQIKDVPREGEFGTFVYRLVDSYTRACGVVEVGELYTLYCELADAPLDAAEFAKALERTTDALWEESPGFWIHDGKKYMVNGGITNRGFLWNLWLQTKHRVVSSEEEYEKGFEDLKRDEPEHLRRIESDRCAIAESHVGKPIRTFTREEVDRSLEPVFSGRDEMQDVRTYVMGLRKRDEISMACDDHNLRFALDSTAFSISDHALLTEDALRSWAEFCLAHGGVMDESEEEVQTVQRLLAVAAQGIPLWCLNGHDARWAAETGVEPACSW